MESPLTQGGPGLPGALRSMIGAHPPPPGAPPAPALASEPATPAEGAAPTLTTTAALFEQAARAHSRRLLAIARAVVGTRASPEDVVQQALVNLYQHRDRYDWHQPGGLLRRAVIITQVAPDDVARPHHAALGRRPAMRVDQVIPGSAADRAGIRVGDLLLSLAGESTRDIPTLSAAIAARNGPTEVQLLRDGEIVTATVDLRQK